MMTNRATESNRVSHVNRIDGVTLDEAGFIHTKYGSYHPVTGEGEQFDMPVELKREILIALIRDGEDSGPAESFDWDEFMKEKFWSKGR